MLAGPTVISSFSVNNYVANRISLSPNPGSGLWIRIRMDPHSFTLLDPDPDPGE